MRVIVVTSPKGGGGKTTPSGHLAVQAERAGCGPVAPIGADPQGSPAAWWNMCRAATPLFVRTGVGRLASGLDELRAKGVRLVVIGTPPPVTATIRSVVAEAGLVVIPTRPSPHDLRALAAVLEIVEARAKSLIFVVNAATPRARITSEAAVALAQHGSVAPVTVHRRTDLAGSVIDGRTVMEAAPASRSAQEMMELWIPIADRLGKLQPRPVPVAGELPAFGRSDTTMPAAPGFGRRAAA